jgi:putative peptidoglycan lipid II flippase
VLAGFALGLIPFSTMPLLLRGFYAYEDTKTPVIINIFATGSMMLLAIIAENVIPFQYITIALAIILGVSNLVGTLLSIRSLEKRVGKFPKRELLSTHFKLLLLASIAILPGVGASLLIREFTGITWISNTFALAIGTLIFALVYIYGGRLAKVEEITSLYSQIMARFRRGSE